MKYRQEKAHSGLRTSLRSGEMPQNLVGDAIAEKRDMEAEQRAAFKKPEEAVDHRVVRDESDQGRTH